MRELTNPQICLNGHIVCECLKYAPEYASNFCRECGEPTISKCKECGSVIEGRIYDAEDPYNSIYTTPIPSYCFNCGKPFPWTEKRLKLANEEVDDMEGISDEEKEQLKKILPDLTTDKPETSRATSTVRQILAKVGEAAYEPLMRTMTPIVTEYVKQKLGW